MPYDENMYGPSDGVLIIWFVFWLMASLLILGAIIMGAAIC